MFKFSNFLYYNYLRGLNSGVMPVNVSQWRAGMCIFYCCTHPLVNMKIRNFSHISKSKCTTAYFYHLFCSMFLLKHGDIEINPGPTKKNHSYFSCCHWNVNSLAALNMLKVSSLEAYNTIHKYDFICISETYLDSSICTDNDDLSINGYKLIRADHPSDTKRGGVCIYHK